VSPRGLHLSGEVDDGRERRASGEESADLVRRTLTAVGGTRAGLSPLDSKSGAITVLHVAGLSATTVVSAVPAVSLDLVRRRFGASVAAFHLGTFFVKYKYEHFGKRRQASAARDLSCASILANHCPASGSVDIGANPCALTLTLNFPA